MLAASCSTASEHSRRPWASVLGAGGAVGVGLAVVAGFGVVGAAVVGVVGAGFTAVVTAGLLGVDLALVTVGLALDAVDLALAAADAPVVGVGFAGVVTAGLADAAEADWAVVVAGVVVATARLLVAAVLAATAVGAPEDPVPVTAGLLDGFLGAEDAAPDEVAAAEAETLEPVAVRREASTPVRVGAADPLTAAEPVVPLGVPPLDRPATMKITPTSTAINTTMKTTRRSQ